MTRILAIAIALLALACSDRDGVPPPATAPDAGHRFVDREEPERPAQKRKQIDAARPHDGVDAAEAKEPPVVPDTPDRAAQREPEPAVPPPAEIH